VQGRVSFLRVIRRPFHGFAACVAVTQTASAQKLVGQFRQEFRQHAVVIERLVLHGDALEESGAPQQAV